MVLLSRMNSGLRVLRGISLDTFSEGRMHEHSTILFLITLRHPNGETRVVPVEHVAKTYVAIRWGEAGLFDLNLLKNVLTGRRAESQPKGKAKWYQKGPNPWVAADIEDVRKQVDVYLGNEDKRKEMEVAIAKHNANMPGANPRIDDLVPRRYVVTHATDEKGNTFPISGIKVSFSGPQSMTLDEIKEECERCEQPVPSLPTNVVPITSASRKKGAAR